MAVNKKTFIMKKLIIPLLLAIYLLSTSASCKKTPIIQFNKEFPNSIGTWWKYKVYDSIYNRLDTVTIRVIGNGKLDNGDDATIWAINSLLHGADTNYVTNKTDGIRIYPGKLISASPNKRYVFPLTVGNYWVTYNILDTNRVTEKGSISVIAGTFSDAYRIKRNTREFPGLYVIQEDEWFVPNIGMVYRNYGSFGTPGVESKIWELVSYQIK
jgi:hypothetical protein